jgi:dTDP-4-dehydrorhamnose reductase
MKVLVLGDGLLGAEIVKQSGYDFISRKKDGFDVNSEFDLNDYVFSKQYDIILNCIACTDTYSNNKELHWNTNYVFVDKIIKYCNTHSIKLIHISSDYVYTNSVNNASETDVPVHFGNWYSYTKLLADALIELQSDNYLICRCTHKPTPFPYDLAWINQIGNFDYANVIAKLIIELIEKEARGLYNVGTELKTMYDLASRTKNVLPALADNRFPTNVSMNLNKLNEIKRISK